MCCLPGLENSRFFQGRRILVTGASSGIGKAVALRCNSLGATVIAVGRNRERLRTVKEQAECPAEFLIEARDLTLDMEALPGWVANLREEHGKLGGFVHSAGHTVTAPLRLFELSEAEKLFAIHFHAPMLLAKGFADRRNNIGSGASMVFLTAASVAHPPRALLAYTSAKSALLTAGRCLAGELAPQGIRVNCIGPGLVETPMSEDYGAMLGEEAFRAVRARYPLGLGRTEDVAALACFLLSEQARWITGQNIVMDGGLN